MLRTKQLVSALSLALAGMGTAQAQEFSSVVSFGDSLSDAGQYTVLISPAAGSFTTNPDDVWTQVLASSFGLSQTASLVHAADSTDYAYGGAPTAFSIPPIPLPLTCIPASLPCKSVQLQIGTYLGVAGGSADPTALYTYWAGANDIFNWVGYASPRPQPSPNPPLPPLITSAQAQQFTGASALNALGQIAFLQGKGAKNIVVVNLPDIGKTPNFTNAVLFPGQATPANSAAVSGLVFVYNTVLNNGLANLADGIIPINAYGLINEVLADPAAYGFTNTTDTACNLALLPPTSRSSLFCSPAIYVTPTANEDYLFADGVHPTGAAHAMLARVVQATIQAPGQVSMAGELPLQVYENHANVVNGQIFGMSRVTRGVGESNVYGQIQYGQADYQGTANTDSFDSNIATATLGADVRYTDWISLGAAITFGSTRGDSRASDIDGKEVLASIYGVAHWGAGYVSGMISGGSNSLDIDRSIDLRASTRHEQGNTSAGHIAFEIDGGFSFGNDDFRHGPYVGVTNQRVRVGDYVEDSMDSTAMWFGEFTRRSSIWRIGYQGQGNFGALRPYGRVAYARDQDNGGEFVHAGSNTMNGHFTMAGYIPSENWWEADLGLAYALNDSTELSFAWRGHLNDDAMDYNTLSIGFRKEFNGPAPVAEEPVAVEPEKTCADLDDDGDGVANCDDKCPGSPSGEAVGADGCPVPAAEPEAEPKPYRNIK